MRLLEANFLLALILVYKKLVSNNCNLHLEESPMTEKTERTVPVRTIAAAFLELVKGGVDINLGADPQVSGFTAFADSDYPPVYETRNPAWVFEEQLRRQVACLQWHFPSLRGRGLGFDRDYAAAVMTNKSRAVVPRHMERWILLPDSWQCLGSTYLGAIFKVLWELKQVYPARGVEWQVLEKLKGNQVLQNPLTERALERAAKQQRHKGLLLVPVQVGRCYAGRSVTHVLGELTREGGREVGFGVIETALFLLYYPDRLGTDYRGLWIDAPGTLIVSSDQLQSPFFRVSDRGKLEIKCSPVTETDSRSGVATFYV